jgi:hypothetical protein
MTQKISKAQTLKKSIEVIRQKQLEQGKLLQEQFSVVYESLKPYNVLRNAIREIVTPSELKGNLIESATGLLSGYLSRKLLVRSSRNPLLRLAGIIVQYGVTKFVVNNSATTKDVIARFFDRIAAYAESKKG